MRKNHLRLTKFIIKFILLFFFYKLLKSKKNNKMKLKIILCILFKKY